MNPLIQVIAHALLGVHGLLSRNTSVFALHNAKPSLREIKITRAGSGLKAVWYGAEQFGNILGLAKPRQEKAKNQVLVCETSHSGLHCVHESAAHPNGMLSINYVAPCTMTTESWAWLQSGISRKDAIAAIRSDYDSNYFVSGKGRLH